MSNRPDNWLAVDRRGLRQILAQKGKARTLLEIPANALDTEATEISIRFEQADGVAVLTVTDDDPNGFASLVDSYTLYAPSTRKGDAEKRGRFGLGDKEVLALCEEATIKSTSGTVVFDGKGRRQTKAKREAGSEIVATLKMTKPEAKEFERLVRSLLIPAGVKVELNGDPLPQREPVRSFSASLPTVLTDEEGNLRPTSRKTKVEIHEVIPGEQATIYELGMPVVEHEGRWHVNVQQKVPLNSDRDNVPPAYLRKLRTAVLDATVDLIDNDDANAVWVRDAFASASDEAQREVIRERYGDKVVVFDPSDKEASKRAQDAGYLVIGGRSLNKEEWEAVKKQNLIPAAGKVFPSGVLRGPEGKDAEVPEDKWTDGMKRVAAYAREVGHYLLGITPTVVVERADIGERYGATFGPAGVLTLNLTRLSHAWFNSPDQQKVDSLLIHEFAHHRALDHFTDQYIDACTDLGAKLRDFDGRL